MSLPRFDEEAYRRKLEAETGNDLPAPGTPLTISLNEVQTERITWLWPGRLAQGKVALLEGDPGVGKSTLTLDLAARITMGRTFPDDAPGVSGNVVLMTAEDDLADTVKPRIVAAGGDSAKVHVLLSVYDGQSEPAMPVFPQDLLALQRTIEAHAAIFVVIDPFVAFLDDQVNSWSDHGVRRALAPFARLASETKACILLIRHLRKTAGGPALYRGGGSIAFIATVRTGLLVANDPDDADHRILAVPKNNLGPPTASLRFHLESAPIIGGDAARIIWDGASDYRPDSLVGDAPSVEDRDQLEDLTALLKDLVPCKADEGLKAVRHAGYSDPHALQKAKTQLGIKSVKVGGREEGAHWEWVYKSKSSHSSYSSNDAPEDSREQTTLPRIKEYDLGLEECTAYSSKDAENAAKAEEYEECHSDKPRESKSDPLGPADAGPPSDRFAGPLSPDEFEAWTERVSILLADGFSESEAEDAAWAEVSERRAADPETYYGGGP